ncbi:vWA domain-containing protein [Thiocapsa bogorovii]|uniref:vWA domain-containing protein n=1 Tax=Thiocapsa bogorovii TaxID=521689 RepID=UPI001E31DFC1|nr:VWA-like domain-containing protein [Thiocapsa bogorovii]UHD14789.1 VWA-like domain-containing protein [Thiocapsa bogorovii]
MSSGVGATGCAVISDTERQAIETKLAAARTRLILDKPFLGALVLRLPMHASNPDWCPTTATDARAFYYNPEYIQSLSLDQTQFMLAHEALHCALSHFARRQHRVKHKWDLACDYAINPLLIDEGLKPPPNALVMPPYKGMTAEEIYPLIDDNDESETLDTHAYDRDNQQGGSRSGMSEKDLDRMPEQPQEQQGESEAGQGTTRSSQPNQADGSDGGVGKPEPLTPDEQETLSVQWQQRLAGAAQQAGKLGGEMARMIDHLLQPRLPWRMLLARYMTAVSRDDYSYARPSRRAGDFIMPSLRSHQTDLVVAVDTSGSIKAEELEEFIGEIDALKGQVRARVTLLPCDAALCEGAPFRFEPWESFQLPEAIRGGGGTSFRPVFQWIDREGVRPDLLVYFTDAQGEFPPAEPAFPVIWLVKGQGKVPWGQRIQLN